MIAYTWLEPENIPDEMKARGMSLNNAGFWITEKMPTNKPDFLRGVEM